MRVLLIRPPYTTDFLGRFSTAEEHVEHFSEPLSLEIVAASITEHDVQIFDMEIEKDLEAKLDDFDPQVVGLGCFCVANVYDTQNVAKRVREYNPEIFLAVGGIGATVLPAEFKDWVDVVVLSEGEITFKELLSALECKREYRNVAGIAFDQNGKLVFTPKRSFVQDLDMLPFPRRDLVKKYLGRYIHSITGVPTQIVSTTRGCASRCKFCAVWRWWGTSARCHTISRIIRDIEKTDSPSIEFSDDNLFNSVDRVEEIARQIRDHGIKKDAYFFFARCDMIAQYPHLIETWQEISDGNLATFIGAEAATEEYLDKFGKSISLEENERAIRILIDNDVFFFCSFMIDPEFDEQDFDRLEEYVDARDIPLPVFLINTPMPGASDYEELKGKLVSHEWNLFDGFSALLPTKLPLEKFYEHFESLWKIARRHAIHFFTSKLEVGKIHAGLLDAWT